MNSKLPNIFNFENVYQLLYHYTTIDAFIKILESECIWASCSNYLNDYNEISITIDGFINYLKKNIETKKNDKEKQFNEKLIKYYNSNSKVNKEQIFIASLSEKGDLLSQWRAYSNDGYGVSIGFHPNFIDLAYPLQIDDFKNKKPYLFPIEYEEKELKKYFKELYKIAIKSMSESEEKKYYTIDRAIEGVIKFDDKRTNLINTFKMLERMAACFKNEGFQEEKEWRIVKFDETYDKLNNGIIDDIDIRISKGLLIPYYKIPIKKDAIKEIIIGPKNEFESVKYSMEILKKKFKYTFNVEKSSITYR